MPGCIIFPNFLLDQDRFGLELIRKGNEDQFDLDLIRTGDADSFNLKSDHMGNANLFELDLIRKEEYVDGSELDLIRKGVRNKLMFMRTAWGNAVRF